MSDAQTTNEVMLDREIVGKCGHTFVFPVRDQEYFKQNGWGDPVRCKPCQRERKARFDRQKNSPFKPILDEVRGTKK